MIAVTGYSHIVEDVAELVNEIHTLDIHFSIATATSNTGALRIVTLACTDKLAKVLPRPSVGQNAELQTGCSPAVRAEAGPQLANVLVEAQHSLVGVGQDPAVGRLG